MLVTLIALLLFLTTFAFGQNVEADRKTFDDWKLKYSRDYSSHAEESHRFEVFRLNLKRIREIQKTAVSYSVGLNQFADLSRKEYIEKFTRTLDKKAFTDGTPTTLRPSSLPPPSINWKPYLTPVINQGSCGSSWAFPAVGTIQTRYAIHHKKLVQLSAQELLDCTISYGNYACSGGLMTASYKYAIDTGGLCSAALYPYEAVQGTCRNTTCTKLDPITGWVVTPNNDSVSMMQALETGPVGAGVDASSDAFRFYSHGVLNGTCGGQSGHGILVVGYGTDNGMDYWELQNTWGTDWGEKGFVRICRNCNRNNGEGQCGLLRVGSTYPTISFN